jgi:ATP-dependent RNA helicase RhlE
VRKQTVFGPRPDLTFHTDNPGQAGCLTPTRCDRLLRNRSIALTRKIPALNSFQELNLAAPINRALAEAEYLTPTPIQSQTIPLVLAGRDVVGIAQTGTGKTAAFALPILHFLNANRLRPERKACRVLVLSPTRELSAQILDSFKTYGRYVPLRATLVIGGVPMGRQVRALADGVDVLVATPGRLLDLLQSHALRLDRVEFLVLDEADRMLDMGFIHDIRRIVAKLPAKRQTLFFSATMPPPIAKLAGEMLRDPARVAVTPVATTVDSVEQRIIHVDRSAKTAVLAQILTEEPIDRALVFTRTKRGADRVVRNLAKSGIVAEAIHGNKSQSQRERVLASFRQGSVRILVATDIAARGIDVDGISHVVQHDLPNEPESYVHRIGRTARAGAAGIAIALCDSDEVAFLRDIEKLIRISIPSTDRRTPGSRPIHANAPRQQHSHNNNGGRPSRGQQRHRRSGASNGHPQRTHQSNGNRPHGNHPPRGNTQNGEIAGVAFLQRDAVRQPQSKGEQRWPKRH